MSIKIKCPEANHVCDKNQYKEATFWEKVRLNIHLIFCKACRKYSARNMKLSKMVKDPKVKVMPKQVKEELKEQIKREMSK